MKYFTKISCFISLCCWCVLSYAQTPVAMVSDLEGQCLIQGQALDILNEVKSGQFIELAQNAKLVLVYFESGKEFSFQGSGRVYIRSDKPIAILGSQPTERGLLLGEEGKRIKIIPGTMVQAALTMRSLQVDQLALLSPKNSKVMDDNVRFNWRWMGRNNVEFRFVLSDQQQTLFSQRGIRSSFFVLPKTVVLKPGIEYVWRVEALSSTDHTVKELQSAAFSLLSVAQQQQVETLRPLPTASFSERLVYAVWLKQLGLKQQSTSYFEQLSIERSQARELQKMSIP